MAVDSEERIAVQGSENRGRRATFAPDVTGFRSSCRRIYREARRAPTELLLTAGVVALTVFVIAYPLSVTRYAPMTDLPFHAAQTSVFRHYLDPTFHFRDQFELSPLAVPYMTQYAIGAALMLVLPAVPAAHVAAGLMLVLVPAGLAVLLWGLHKSPLWSVASLPLVWGGLTQWGFISFVAALGLFAMAVGLMLRLTEKPSRGRQIALAATLCALFFTHVFRFPFAILAVVGGAALMYPTTRRIRPVLVAIAPSLLLFALWLAVRPSALQADFGDFDLHPERIGELERVVFGGFRDARESELASAWLKTLAVVVGAVVAVRLALPAETRIPKSKRARLSIVLSSLVALGCFLGFSLMFMVLPMQAGIWWYIYPREAVAACFVLLALVPDMPKNAIARAALVVALAIPGARMATFVAGEYRAFGRSTDDFHVITRQIPKAPRLAYLVFDHEGSSRSTTPYLHLPAYVQAERGGWLSFHFAAWGASPVMYRSDAPPGALPPRTPLRWEWTPQRFRVLEHGAFFDWFLIRRQTSPDALLAADPSIERVDHVGTWWLYRRRPSTETAPP